MVWFQTQHLTCQRRKKHRWTSKEYNNSNPFSLVLIKKKSAIINRNVNFIMLFFRYLLFKNSILMYLHYTQHKKLLFISIHQFPQSFVVPICLEPTPCQKCYSGVFCVFVFYMLVKKNTLNLVKVWSFIESTLATAGCSSDLFWGKNML